MNTRFCRAALALAALCLALPASALADLPKPDANNKDAARVDAPTSKENTLKLVIEAGEPGQEAQIWLPPSLHAAIPADNGATAAGLAPMQTVGTGLALSLSIVFGGLWLVRSRRKLGTRATCSAAVVFGVLAGTAVYAFANAAPPRNYHPVDPGTLRLAAPTAEALSGTVRYYYGYDEGVVRIVLPKPQQ